MALRLRGRYMLVLVTLSMFIVVLLSGVFLFVLRSSLDEHASVSSRAMTADLRSQMEKRGEVITRLLAENLRNPIYYYDMQAIYELLAATKQMNDVLYATLLDTPSSPSICLNQLHLADTGSVSLLSSNTKLDWLQTNAGLMITLPASLPDAPAHSLKITPKPALRNSD